MFGWNHPSQRVSTKGSLCLKFFIYRLKTDNNAFVINDWSIIIESTCQTFFFADSLYCMLFSWVHVGTQCVKKLNRSVFGEVVLTSE